MSTADLETLEVAQMRMQAARMALRGFLSLLESASPGAAFSAENLKALIAPAVAEVSDASDELATVVH
jgi:hypothetical protein